MHEPYFKNAPRYHRWGGGIEQGNNSARGALTVTARVSGEASRYAMPTIPTLTYAATLYKATESPEYEKFVEGAKATNSDNLIFSFQRPEDTSGTFTLEVFAFVKADVEAEDGTKSFSRAGALFSGGKDGLAIEGDEIQVSDPIALSSGKPATVNLKIKVPDGCTLEVGDARFTATQDGDASNIYTITANGISAGSYPVTFTVKKGDEIIHVFSENINVLKGLCTDTWWNGSVYCDVKDVAQSISKTLYVRGTGGWYDATSPYNEGETAKASDDNLGSFSSPFATIQKAIDKVIAMNDGTSEYTIKIDGKLTQSTFVENMARITPDRSLNLTIESMSTDTNATLDAANNVRRALNISSGVGGMPTVMLKNIHIIGAYNGIGYGGGIYVSGSSFTMVDCKITECTAERGGGVYVNGGMLEMKNCKVEDNIATESMGGGIYIDNGGKVTMDGGIISGNEVMGSGTKYGGGVFISHNLSKFTMKGGTISGNILSDYTSRGGGGVCVSSGTFEMEDGTISGGGANYGGGVFIGSSGTFTMSGGELTGNVGTTLGGGVYIASNGIFAMQGGTISNCTAGSGGGIYNSGTLTVENGTKISGCKSYNYGGGIYCANSSTVAEISGCTIELCRAISSSSEKGGGGICNNGATLTVTGGTIYKCTAEQGSNGGGILLLSSLSSLTAHTTITDVTISECTANIGGGIHNYNGRSTFTVTGGAISKCIATTSGGGIYNNAEDTSNISTITNCEISGCKANDTTSSDGGGIYNNSGALELIDVTITGGNDVENLDASHYAGGVFVNGGMLTMNSGEISDCTARYGGAVYICNGNFTMNGVTISGNTAKDAGGGVFVRSGVFTMNGDTISKNKATDIAGGVYVDDDATFTMNSGTISENTAKVKGGVYISGGTFNPNGGTVQSD